MGRETSISWCDATFNPWWGCTRVSPGCTRCYAETFDRRVSGVEKAHWGVKAERRLFGDNHWALPVKWNAAAERDGERLRVFCASMADVFEDREDLVEHRARLFALIEATPSLDWLLLTKRPENMVRLAAEMWPGVWPENVWAGCTIEDQQRAEERVPELLGVPAAIRFLSYEPALERINLSVAAGHPSLRGIDWVIIGGESGPGARPFNRDWARSVIDQCRRAGVAPFVKQLGAKPVGISLQDPKGGDWEEWPAELRVREFPEAAHA